MTTSETLAAYPRARRRARRCPTLWLRWRERRLHGGSRPDWRDGRPSTTSSWSAWPPCTASSTPAAATRPGPCCSAPTDRDRRPPMVPRSGGTGGRFGHPTLPPHVPPVGSAG